MNRNTFLRLSLLAAGSAMTATRGWAADFPDRPIRIVNPFAPGGTMEVAARLLMDKMGARLGQPVVLENRPGAAGTVGGAYVAKGQKDGYTIYYGTSATLGFSKLIYKDQGYDPVSDFTPIAMVANVPVGIFIGGNLGINSIQELVAAAKAKPGSFSYASSGQMGLTHLAGEMLAQRAGIKLLHVPYSGAQMRYWSDLIGGQIQIVISGVTAGLPLIQDGRAKLLATATRTRLKRLPDVPALGEIYPGFETPAWIGFAVAKGTPPDVVAKLEAAVLAALNDPATRTAYEAAGLELDPIMGSSAFAARIPADLKMWEETLLNAGLLK